MRHPVGAAVLGNTRAQSALMRPGPHTDALRDIVSDLMDLPEVNGSGAADRRRAAPALRMLLRPDGIVAWAAAPGAAPDAAELDAAVRAWFVP